MKLIKTFGLLIVSFIVNSSCNTKKKEIFTNKPLHSIYLNKEYAIKDTIYGTRTVVSLKEGQRIMTTNALPNHNTGEFPNHANPNTISEQDKNYKFPLEPKYTGEARWAREPGIAVNGIKFEPETAERFVCETGELYRVEAVQDLIAIGLDFNNAHVQPTGAYHYHGAPTELIKKLDKGEDLILIGFAHDGFPMYYSKSGKYTPSFQLSGKSRIGDVCVYDRPHMHSTKKLTGTQPDGTFVSDWEYKEGLGNLDECNGTEINGSYAYVITDTYPYVGRCLKGEYEEERPKGPPPGDDKGEHKDGPPLPRGNKGKHRDGPPHSHGNGEEHTHR